MKSGINEERKKKLYQRAQVVKMIYIAGLIILCIMLYILRSTKRKKDWKETYEKDFVDFIANSSSEDIMKWNN